MAAPKPAAEMIGELLLRLDSRPCETLVVGDSELDLQMGKAAGCLTCALICGAHSVRELQAHGPDGMVDEFPRLLDIEPVGAALRSTDCRIPVAAAP